MPSPIAEERERAMVEREHFERERMKREHLEHVEQQQLLSVTALTLVNANANATSSRANISKLVSVQSA